MVEVLEVHGLRTGAAMSEGRRRWTSQLRKRETAPFLCLSVPLGLEQIGRRPLTLLRVDRFTQPLTNQTPPQTQPEVVSGQLSGRPLGLSS